MSHKQCYVKRETLAHANKMQAEVIGELRTALSSSTQALRLARSYIGSLTGKEVPGIKGLAAVPVLFAIDAALRQCEAKGE